jgi:hypothetical protein
MGDHSSSKLGQQMSESLWAISDEGIIWQINPLSRDAAPVLHLDELPARERLSFQQYIMRGWAGKRGRDSVPEDIERFVREICLAHRQRQ